ncbi:GDSL-type esterase/lipase family protein [Marinomonas transparens]|uniref:Acetylglucosamine-6-sulfatase n=1 Tax=Marinomonas transparens TaxID=2795388 RepID=A0A934JVA3_9GAMM|nr:GDSL-type esterase/lipase family protein [Marinomonas transparens]MBJ7537904.1 acetylglucosamine-6-sulfatase [Marinomonas transparens]
MLFSIKLRLFVVIEIPLSVVPAKQETDWWLPRHEAKLVQKEAMDRVDLVFLGDSITQAWEVEGADIWDEFYRPRNALNLGFNGDRTEHVLWRLEQGEVDDIQPKLLVLLIGTNNTGHRQDKAEDTALGIKKILDVLAEKLPHTKILLLAIFPRSAKPTQQLRVLNDSINQIIQHYGDDERVFYLDINAHFLTNEGVLSRRVAKDFLHPNGSQYSRWADLIEPSIQRLMK